MSDWSNAENLSVQTWDGVTRPVPLRQTLTEIHEKLYLHGIICANCFRLGVRPDCNACGSITYHYLIDEDGTVYDMRAG